MNIRTEASQTAMNEVMERIAAAEKNAGRDPGSVQLIVVSKTFPVEDIGPVLQTGQRQFGENRVQESLEKWPSLKADFPDVILDLIGPLQSNKTADAVSFFDAIHTVDREKIAAALARETRKQDRYPELFVQVNTGEEPQKAGIFPGETVEFVRRCLDVYGLNIEGLMCIPPVNENPGPHFALLAELASKARLSKLSMGMSSDFELAIEFGATHVRVGSAVFGER